MRHDGLPRSVAVDGEVIEADPPRKLVQTWRMLMDEGMAAEGFTRLTYEIEPRKEGVTRLTVDPRARRRAELAAADVGRRWRIGGAGGGWSWVLSGLKTLLETGESLDPSGGHQG